MHTFLEIKIRYLKNRRITISMKEYITDSVQEFREDVSKGSDVTGGKMDFQSVKS